MPLFKIKTRHLKDYSVPTEKFSNTAVIAFAQTLTPKVRLANVANSAFTILDDTAVNIGGGYIVLTGSEFQSGAQVLVGNTPATSTSFVNSTILRAEVPARPAGTYNVFVVNPDGGTSIRVGGITYSAIPSFSTATTLTDGNQITDTNFSLSISASSDSNISYSNTTPLPNGTTLLSNGWFYGANIVSIGTGNVSFTVKATDVELQDTSRTFELSIDNFQRLYTIGRGTYGQLGLNDTTNRSSPTQVGSSINWQSLDFNENHTVGIKTNGTLWMWGRYLGASSPVQVGSDTDWRFVSTGITNTWVGLKSNNTIWIGGITPSQGTGTNWNTIDQHDSVYLGTKTDGTLWSWGDAGQGVNGRNSSSGSVFNDPLQIGALTNWSNAITGNFAALALKNDGTLWSWGRNLDGQAGQGDVIRRSSPTQVGTGTNWNKIALNQNGSSFAIKTDGTLWAWGKNLDGESGVNDRVVRSSPVQVGTNTNWSSISSWADSSNSRATTVALKTDGTAWIWGSDSNGQLGLNNTGNRSSPTQIGTANNWILAVTGGYKTVLISRGPFY